MTAFKPGASPPPVRIPMRFNTFTSPNQSSMKEGGSAIHSLGITLPITAIRRQTVDSTTHVTDKNHAVRTQLYLRRKWNFGFGDCPTQTITQSGLAAPKQ